MSWPDRLTRHPSGECSSILVLTAPGTLPPDAHIVRVEQLGENVYRALETIDAHAPEGDVQPRGRTGPRIAIGNVLIVDGGLSRRYQAQIGGGELALCCLVYEDELSALRGYEMAIRHSSLVVGLSERSMAQLFNLTFDSQQLRRPAGEVAEEVFSLEREALAKKLGLINKRDAVEAATWVKRSLNDSRGRRNTTRLRMSDAGAERRLLEMALRSLEYAPALSERVSTLKGVLMQNLQNLMFVLTVLRSDLESPAPAFDPKRKTARAAARRRKLAKEVLPKLIEYLSSFKLRPFGIIARNACVHLKLVSHTFEQNAAERSVNLEERVNEARLHLARAVHVLGRALIVSEISSLVLKVSFLADERFAIDPNPTSPFMLAVDVEETRRRLGTVGSPGDMHAQVPYQVAATLKRAATFLRSEKPDRAKACLKSAIELLVG